MCLTESCLNVCIPINIPLTTYTATDCDYFMMETYSNGSGNATCDYTIYSESAILMDYCADNVTATWFVHNIYHEITCSKKGIYIYSHCIPCVYTMEQLRRFQ